MQGRTIRSSRRRPRSGFLEVYYLSARPPLLSVVVRWGESGSMKRAEVGIFVAVFLLAGCGRDEKAPPKDAGPASPEQAAPKASIPDDPQVARILPLLDDYANVVKTAAEGMNKFDDDDSAFAVGKKLKQAAERIRGLSKELKSVGTIRKQQDGKLSAARSKTLIVSGQALMKAGLERGKRFASVKLSAEALKAFGEGDSEFNSAIQEFNLAIVEIEETKQRMVP
jgi:hypothetical protein